jgi:hypothetical protein
MGVQARSRRNRGVFSNALFIFFLFAAGITAGIWVSMRYFNDPIADYEFPRPSLPGRLDRIITVPKWLDHPYTRTENPYLADFQYRGPRSFDLNQLFFGTAMASVPVASALAMDYQLRKAQGLVNANDERVYQDRFEGESRAAVDRFGRMQGDRAIAQAREGLADERKNIGEDTMRALRIPGMALYLAASTMTGRPVRARFGPGTVVRTQTVSKDDYRVRIDQQVGAIGLGVGSGYDSLGRRRSVALTKSLGEFWMLGVDRTLSSVQNRGNEKESALRVQFSAPF